MASKAKKFKFPKRTFAYYKKIGPKAFCDKFLFPAMRREHGNGFAMQTWTSALPHGYLHTWDGVERPVPACGTVCCIGGTAVMLLKEKISIFKLGELLGLDNMDTNSLFFRWGDSQSALGDIMWPENMRQKFAAAQTPKQKERVAEQMVRLAVRTKGKCFHPKAKVDML